MTGKAAKRAPRREPKQDAKREVRRDVERDLKRDVQTALAWLEKHASKKTRDEMGPRYGVHTASAFGVSMADMKKFAIQCGRSHELALALWDTGWYEARMVAAMVDEPARVTAAQMERWCKAFDNWGICDTVCFKLFDQVPLAYGKIPVWCARRAEFERRAGFALLACVALHDKAAGDAPFIDGLRLSEQGASDERNFVWKAVSWAIRAIGERNATLRKAATDVAARLAASSNDSERRVGKDALKALTGKAVAKRALTKGAPTKAVTKRSSKRSS